MHSPINAVSLSWNMFSVWQLAQTLEDGSELCLSVCKIWRGLTARGHDVKQTSAPVAAAERSAEFNHHDADYSHTYDRSVNVIIDFNRPRVYLVEKNVNLHHFRRLGLFSRDRLPRTIGPMLTCTQCHSSNKLDKIVAEKLRDSRACYLEISKRAKNAKSRHATDVRCQMYFVLNILLVLCLEKIVNGLI